MFAVLVVGGIHGGGDIRGVRSNASRVEERVCLACVRMVMNFRDQWSVVGSANGSASLSTERYLSLWLTSHFSQLPVVVPSPTPSKSRPSSRSLKRREETAWEMK